MKRNSQSIILHVINKRISIIFLLLILLNCFTHCEEDRQPVHSSTITLWDKPLSVIQSYTAGKWKLQYSFGGLWAHRITDTHSSYLHLSQDHIIAGNDSLGVVVDTSIVWVRAMITGNDSTYLLSYYWRGYLFPEHFIVNQIKNDTLILSDYGSDGFKYYYTKY